MNFNKKRAQISIEYLIVIGFVVFLIITMIGVAFVYSSNIQDKLRSNQLDYFANKVISSSETVYYSGPPSKLTVKAYLPSGITGISISGNQILFNFTTNTGLNKISYKSDVPLTGSLSINEGVKRIVISAQTGNVLISE